MQENYSSITMLIIDESGSMRQIKNFVEELHSEITSDIIKGIPKYPGIRQFFECWCFNSTEISQRTPLMELLEDSIVPFDFDGCGRTPLLDAIGTAISKLESRIKYNPVLANIHVDVCIVTDGYENHSKEYTYDGIKQMITHKEKQGWKFSYYGANHDVKHVGNRLSIIDINTFEPNKGGIKGVSKNFRSKLIQSKEDYFRYKKGGRK